MQTRQGWIITFVLVGVACSGSDLPRPVAIEKVAASDGQLGTAGGPLPAPLTVRVTAEDGTRAVRAEVRWSVVTGNGAVLSDTVTLSDGLGEAQVWMTLGSIEGEYEVEAELKAAASQRVVFSAVANPGVRLTGVTPATFTAGQIISLSGSGFTDSTTVRIDGELADATVVSATQAIGVVVPFCLTPGPVSIVAIQGGAPSAPVSGTFQGGASEISLAPTEYISIPAARIEDCVTFPTVAGDSAIYLVVPHSGATVADQLGTYALGSDSAATVIPATQPQVAVRSHAQQFHDWLRQREAEIAALPKPAIDAPELAPALAAQIGDRRRFKVCASVTCSAAEDFPEITAQVKYVGTHAVIYEDLDTPLALSESDVATLGDVFDQDLYEVGSRAFGAESDIDRNGVTFILLTPKVNGLTPKTKCSQAIITGFFYPADLDPAFRNSPFSNQTEIFYSLAPDPSGSVTCDISVDRLKRQVPGTFIHELQHMISYNQHVLLRGGEGERLWLNEGMSHIAEELGGRRFLDQGDTLTFSRMVISDVLNAYTYLRNPQAHRLVADTGFTTLSERGAAWLFLRWLVDQYGETVLRRMSESGLNGSANVEQATGAPFGELLSEWLLATYVSDLDNFTPPPRLQYTSWRFRTTWGNLNNDNPNLFPVPFPIAAPQLAAGDFLVVVTLRSGSGDYFRIGHPAGEPAFTLRLQMLDGPGAALIAPLVSVLRIR